MTIKILMLGFGNVGQALGQLLERKRPELEVAYGLDYQIVAIATGSHGIVMDQAGLNILAAVDLAQSGGDLEALAGVQTVESPLELIDTVEADVLFENTPVDYDSGQPAISHIERAIGHGMHAITANKGPVVHAYEPLSELAQKNGVRFLFESTVMDGAPLFSLWREALPGAQLLSFRGLINSTTNLILTRMEEGDDFEEAVRQAQAIGIAETDPSGDTEGWDAAIKVAALATVLMEYPIKPADVDRKGIEKLTLQDIQDARAEGQRWKLVCEAVREGNVVRASVQPMRVDRSDPLFNVMGTSAAVTFKSDVLGPLTIAEDDAGPQTTAYGLLADFVQAVGKT